MKKVLVSLGIGVIAVGVMLAKTEKEAVLMTVDGRPVYKSEFEYLYNKNAGQQIEKQSLDDYVEMFVNYKLKVADALANHYDTTSTFKKELSQYRAELAAPYMLDKEAEKQLLDEAYERYKKMVKVSHIMLQGDGSKDNEAVIARADSIRNEILAGRLDWDEAAKRFSIDRGSNQQGGSMGWIMPGRYPAPFEDAAYSLSVGEISQPVNSGFGFHLVRVDAVKPNPGEVKARHILKLTARKSPEDAAKAKEQIDSIYNVLMAGGDFADIARRESEDPGSKANGGELDWFSSGTMVAPFDSAAFSMAEGVISRPIQTNYGWHIIEVTGYRPMKTRAEAESLLKGWLLNSEKGSIPAERFMEKMKQKYNSRLLTKNLDKIEEMIASNPGGFDSVMIAQLNISDIPVAEVNGKGIAVREVMKNMPATGSKDVKNARALLNSAAQSEVNIRTREQAQIDMINTNPDYRNLVNEYSDGILLFDISQDRVWQKATNDREGLEAFFKAHRKDYSFDEPRFKGVVVFTTSDSLENVVKDYLNSLDKSKINTANLGKELREKFGKHVRAERVIAKKGENAITDFLAFGGEKPEGKNISWSNYFAFMGQIIEQPQEADDVKSKVVTDYQNQLEKEWVNELRKKYPVKVDNKVLKTVKEISVK